MFRLYCIAVLSLLFVHTTSAQFNLKVGYNLGIVDAPVHDAILDQHNSLMDSYDKPFKQLKSLHGFEIGVRQRMDAVSLEFGWKLQRNMLRAIGNLNNGPDYENEITYGIQSLSGGLHLHAGAVSVGGTLDYNWLRVRMKFAEPDFDEVMNDNLLSSDFSLTYTIPSDGVIALALRPFMRVHWGEYDITGIDSNLNNNVIAEPLKDNFVSYGLSIVVFNGYQ